MKRYGFIIMFLVFGVFLFSQQDIIGDYDAQMLFSTENVKLHISDNKIIDITIGDKTTHGKYVYYKEGDVLEIIEDGSSKMDFKIKHEDEYIDLFLITDSNESTIEALENGLNLPDNINEITIEFKDKFKEKIIELFNEVPFFRLKRK